MRLFVALAIATGSVLAQTRPTVTPSTGLFRIAGRVLNASAGGPVARAVVALLAEGDSHTVASVVSDSEGRFAFERLNAAKYQLTASKRGFRTAFYDEHEEYNTAIVTGPDQDTEHLRFRLAPGAVLQGVVSGDDGEPVEGARVMLAARPRHHKQNERIVQVDSATTDDTGAYEFSNLPPGDYMLAVAAQPWYALHRAGNSYSATLADNSRSLDVAYPITYFGSTTDEATASSISLTGGAREEADISLQAVPALHISVEATRRTDGNIARPELQQFVFGTQVPVESHGDIDTLNAGAVEFNGVAPGHYELTMGDPPRIVELDATASQQVDPNAGIPGTTITGMLRMAAEMLPPEEASLVFEPQDGTRRRSAFTTTAHNGRFSFATITPGSWALTVESGGRELPVVSIGIGAGVNRGNVLTVRDQPLNVVVTLSQGITRIEGYSLKDGKGFAGAMIVLVPQVPAAMQALARRDQSDSDGSFALRDIAPGQYTIVAIEDGWDLDWSQPEVIGRYLPKGTPVSVTADSSAQVKLEVPVAVQPR
jgi:protocatechuate 3,4-dioxygenase beta subunit